MSKKNKNNKKKSSINKDPSSESRSTSQQDPKIITIEGVSFAIDTSNIENNEHHIETQKEKTIRQNNIKKQEPPKQTERLKLNIAPNVINLPSPITTFKDNIIQFLITRPIFMLVYISIFCYIALYATPTANDFLIPSIVKQSDNIISVITTWYSNVDGRVASVLLRSLFEIIFPISQAYWPIIFCTLLCYGLSAFILIKAIFKISFKKAIFAALAIVSVSLAFWSSLHDTLYWANGNTYIWSMSVVFLTIASGTKALNEEHAKGAFACSLALISANGLMLEQAALCQIIVLCGISYYWTKKYNPTIDNAQKLQRLYIMCIFAVASGLILALSPGDWQKILAVWKFPSLQNEVLNSGLSSNGINFIDCITSMTLITFTYSLTTLFFKFFCQPITWICFLFIPYVRKLPFRYKWTKLYLSKWQIIKIILFFIFANHALTALTIWNGNSPQAITFTMWLIGLFWFILICISLPDTWNESIEALMGRWRWVILITFIVLNFNFIEAIVNINTIKYYKNALSAQKNLLHASKNTEKDISLPMSIWPPSFFHPDTIGFPSPSTNKHMANVFNVKSIIFMPNRPTRSVLDTTKPDSFDAPLLIDGQTFDNTVPMYKAQTLIDNVKQGDIYEIKQLADHVSYPRQKSPNNTNKFRGNPNLQYMIGRLYDRFHESKEIDKDDQMALEWYEKAAYGISATSAISAMYSSIPLLLRHKRYWEAFKVIVNMELSY